MTQEQFDRLPEWLRGATVRELVQVSPAELRVLRMCNEGLAEKLDGCLHWRYSKRAVARLLRFRYNGPQEPSGQSQNRGTIRTP